MEVAEHQAELLNKLRISPPKFIVYHPYFRNMTVVSATLSNPTSSTITFKMQTTSPLKIRCSPGCGYVPPNENTTVSITLKIDKEINAISKFNDCLIFVMGVPPPNWPTNARTLWKSANSPTVTRCYRLLLVPAIRLKTKLPKKDNNVETAGKDAESPDTSESVDEEEEGENEEPE